MFSYAVLFLNLQSRNYLRLFKLIDLWDLSLNLQSRNYLRLFKLQYYTCDKFNLQSRNYLRLFKLLIRQIKQIIKHITL